MSKIILLGSSGFVGKNISEFFTNRGVEVLPLSSKDCNLLDYTLVDKKLDILNQDDTLVITSSITRLIDNSVSSMNKNILMIQNIIDKVAIKRVKQIVFFSSIDVYGIKNIPDTINEQTPFNPDDYYATSKAVSEYILKVFCSKNDIRLNILRPSGIYGKYDYNNSTIAKIVKNIYNNRSANIVGDGLLKRDFIYIEDLMQILDSVIKSEFNGVVNAVTGSSLSIKELIEKVFHTLGIPANINYEKVEQDSGFVRAGDLSFDTKMLKENIPGFNPKPIDSSLKEYIELFRSHNEK